MQQAQATLQKEVARLSGENSNLAAQKSSLEEDLKAAQTARDRLGAAQKQGDQRLAATKRDLDASEAKASAAATELEQMRRELQRLTERQATTEQALAAQKEQSGTLQATLRTRDEALARSTASDQARAGELAQCRGDNTALSTIASDLLTAIDRAGVGQALLGTEPFSGFKRVRIEALIQDYRDKIDDRRLGSGPR
jgi:chromosome segregation ATPase